ncbi:MAG: hypothetical protein ACTSUE_00250 [Promethearchaeota archaeon]
MLKRALVGLGLADSNEFTVEKKTKRQKHYSITKLRELTREEKDLKWFIQNGVKGCDFLYEVDIKFVSVEEDEVETTNENQNLQLAWLGFRIPTPNTLEIVRVVAGWLDQPLVSYVQFENDFEDTKCLYVRVFVNGHEPVETPPKIKHAFKISPGEYSDTHISPETAHRIDSLCAGLLYHLPVSKMEENDSPIDIKITALPMALFTVCLDKDAVLSYETVKLLLRYLKDIEQITLESSDQGMILKTIARVFAKRISSSSKKTKYPRRNANLVATKPKQKFQKSY